MGQEGLQDPLVPAGKQANEKAWEENGGDNHGSSVCGIYSTLTSSIKCRPRGNCKPLSDKYETTGKEDEYESW